MARVDEGPLAEPCPPAVQVALAVLLVGGRYALQLRDDKPGISAPGLWGLFGGAIEDEENPHAAVLREVEEELAIRPEASTFLWHEDVYSDFHRVVVRHWLFEVEVTQLWPRHDLLEGQAAAVFLYEDALQLPAHPLILKFLKRHHRERTAPPRTALPGAP